MLKHWKWWFDKRKPIRCKHAWTYIGFARVGKDILGGHRFKCIKCNKTEVRKNPYAQDRGRDAGNTNH